MISIGDMGTYAANTVISGNRVIAKSLDDRIGCYIMIEAMKRIKIPKTPFTLFLHRKKRLV